MLKYNLYLRVSENQRIFFSLARYPYGTPRPRCRQVDQDGCSCSYRRPLSSPSASSSAVLLWPAEPITTITTITTTPTPPAAAPAAATVVVAVVQSPSHQTSQHATVADAPYIQSCHFM